MGEEVEEVDEEQEDDDYYEYGEEHVGAEGEEQDVSYNVEVELGSGRKQTIKLSEQEYN